MGAVLELRMLGPFEVRIDGGVPAPIGGLRQRALLAVLALHANNVVSTDRLVDQLWGEHAPDRAVHTVRVFVSRLRNSLGAASDRLITRPPGYVLELGVDELDLARYERLYEASRRAMGCGDAEDAAALLAQAQTLWRGQPLAEFTYEPFAQAAIARLEELWVSGREELIEAMLALGRHAAVIADLEALVREHPFRERPRGQLMLALYRCGRQVEALQAFREARQTLVDELAVEPSQPLRDLEQAILRQDEALTAPPITAEKDPQAPGLVVEPYDSSAKSESVEQVGSDMIGPATVRKTATVLVANITTNFGIDPERAERMIATAREEVQRRVSYHGGVFIPGSSGDDVAVFGIPVTNEDDALRALRAAHEIHSALTSDPDRGLVVRLGVDTGVIAATPKQVIGEPRNRAVDLVHAAQGDHVLIGDETRRLASDLVRAESALDGAAWRLLEIVDQVPPRREVFDTPIFGRDDEVAVACKTFARAARERTAYQLTVVGEPGIGKSRLAHEVTQRLGDEALVLVGRCLSYGDGVAFWPLREAFAQAATEQSRDAIRGLLEGANDADTVADVAATAMGLGSVPNVSEQIPWAFRRLIEVLAEQRPVILAIEDAHWAEAPLLDLVEYLIDWLRAPVLVLCLTRPELLDARPGWGGGHPRVSSLVLSGLDDEAVARLLAHQLRGREMSVAQSAQILDAAEGNPLFVEQLLQASAEDPRWDDERTVPATIQSLLAARLDRLGPGERAYIERAAVIGREFWPEAVLELLPLAARRSAADYLSGLVRRGLMHPGHSTTAGDARVRFHHILIRDVAYRSTSKALRGELHERFAEWLRARGGAYEEFVGYHLERAFRYRCELEEMDDAALAVAERAVDSLSDAGRRAFARGDVNAAVSLLRIAADVLERSNLTRPEVLLALGRGLSESSDFGDAERVLQTALVHTPADATAMRARVLIELSYWRSRADPSAHVDDALVVAGQAIDVFKQVDDQAGLARAWLHIGWAHWIRSRGADMEPALERALEYAERAGERRERSNALTYLARCYVYGPRPVKDALPRCKSLLDRADGDASATALINAMLAVLEAMDGQFEDARHRWRQSKQRLVELGLSHTVAVIQMSYGYIELLATRPELAEPELAEACAAFERMGDQGRLSSAAAIRARLLYLERRHEDSDRYSRIAESAASDDDIEPQVSWRGSRAMILARAGRGRVAERLSDEAVALARDTDFLMHYGDALRARAEVMALLDRPNIAAQDLGQAIAIYERKGITSSALAARRAVEAVVAASAVSGASGAA